MNNEIKKFFEKAVDSAADLFAQTVAASIEVKLNIYENKQEGYKEALLMDSLASFMKLDGWSYIPEFSISIENGKSQSIDGLFIKKNRAILVEAKRFWSRKEYKVSELRKNGAQNTKTYICNDARRLLSPIIFDRLKDVRLDELYALVIVEVQDVKHKNDAFDDWKFLFNEVVTTVSEDAVKRRFGADFFDYVSASSNHISKSWECPERKVIKTNPECVWAYAYTQVR